MASRKKKGKILESEKNYHHGSLKKALVKAATELLAIEGAYHLSLRKTAARAGVSHSAPYRHFKDKNALLAAVSQEGFERLSKCLEQALVLHPDSPVEQYIESGCQYVSFALENPEHLKVMFGGFVEDYQKTEGLRKAGERAFAILVQIIENGQKAGKIQQGESRSLALASWSLVHGLAILTNENGAIAKKDAKSVTRLLVNFLYKGIEKK